MDDYKRRGYGEINIGMKGKVGIVVVDFQLAFTQKKYPLGGAPLVMRALENTSRLMKVARAHQAPTACCFTAYKSERDAPHWKITAVCEQFRVDHPSSVLDPKIFDERYDLKVRKTGPSIFFQTPVVPYFIKEGVETVVITGCNTSGCIRASVIDSFQWGFRTIVPEDCVGDIEEGPHHDNLRDVGRRYADITNSDEVVHFIETGAVAS
ncbi:MAG: isochorismatase family protein [Candidimonas sp.]|nr:MAG: isochorismatase family protein [Candidimonas sp.]